MFFLKQATKFIGYTTVAISLITVTSSASLASVVTYQPSETDAKDVWVQPSHAGVGNDEVLHVWKSNAIGGFKSLYQIPHQVSNVIPLSGNANHVSSATLNLYVLDTEGGGHSSHAPGFEGLTVPIRVTAMANSWVEESLVGGSTEAIQFWNNSTAANGSAVAQINVAGEDIGSWISLDVTDHVRSWVDYTLSNGTEGLPYYGFLIEATEEVRASDGGLLLTAYHSSAASDATLRPYLEITTVPLPTTVWLFGSALIGLMQFNKKAKNKHLYFK
jgi:hypothetical protein